MQIVRWTAIGAPDQEALPLRAHGSRPRFTTLLALISLFDLELSSQNNSRDPELVSEPGRGYAGSTSSMRRALGPIFIHLASWTTRT